MPITKRTRFEVLRRDGHTCRYCGASAPEMPLTVDHVVPTSLGGTDHPGNLVTACQECNVGKASSNPDQAVVTDVAEDAEQWSRAMETAVQNSLSETAARDDFIEELSPVLDQFSDWEMPSDWVESLSVFHASGLPASMMREALETALNRRGVYGRQQWRYACGIAWNMIRNLQEDARRILREESEQQ